jgi:hypothetical protein
MLKEPAHGSVAKATAVAGAVKDIPAMVPHPDPSALEHPLSLRQRPLSPATNRSPDKRPGLKQDDNRNDVNEEEKPRPMSSSTLERGLSSDAKFPRIPTPTLNGSKPRLGYGMPKQIIPPPLKPPAEKDKEGEPPISLLLVDDNVSSTRGDNLHIC